MRRAALSAAVLLFLAVAAPAVAARGGFHHFGPGTSDPTLPSGLGTCLARLSAEVVTNANPQALAAAAQVWNKAFDPLPLAVVFPKSIGAVAGAVKCARAAGVKVTARSGGSSFMGYCVRNGTITIDLSKFLNAVTVSPDKATVTVQGGARLGQVYYNVWKQAGELVTMVAGTCPSVGVGGHVQGGGEGYITMLHGLACDQLVSLTLVNAQGQLVTASSLQNADLFAASCGGGGGNFGVLVSMVLRLAPVAPLYTMSSVQIAPKLAAGFLAQYDKVISPTANLSLFMEPHMFEGAVTVKLHFPSRQAALEAELRRVGLLGSRWVPATSLDASKTQQLSWIQSAVAFAAEQARNNTPEALLDYAYMAATRDQGGFREISYCSPTPTSAKNWQAVLNVLNEQGLDMQMKRAGPNTAVGRVAANATGFPWRQALWCCQVATRWQKPGEQAAALAKLERVRSVLNPIFGKAGIHGYLNYIDANISSDPLESYYGSNLPALSAVKRRVDPGAFFSTNPLAIPV